MKKPTLIYYEILKYQPENIGLLKENFEVVSLPDPGHDTHDVLRRADAVLAPLGYYFGKDKIDQAARLKIIASNTTGDPHIDVVYARQKGIKVITLRDHQDFLKTITPTAELTWGLVIALVRNVLPAYRSVLDGKWDRKPFGGAGMLSRMSLGVVGYGRLGSMVAAYGRTFGMTVRCYDPFVQAPPSAIENTDSLEALVQKSDIVTVHVPHLRKTEKMFDGKVFKHFKKGAYFINTSRGELVDHEALLKCLKDGTLAGAALDVFEGEFSPGFTRSLKDHPLVKYARGHSNVIITPHIGGSTIDAWRLTEAYTINLIMRHMYADNTRRV